MDFKKGLGYIKQEIDTNEKMLESAFRIESVLRKYKTPLIIIITAIIVFLVGYNANNYYKEIKQEEFSKLYTLALKDDKDAIKKLEESQSHLYDLYLFQRAIKTEDIDTLKKLENSKVSLIAQLSRYQSASIEKNKDALKDSNIDLGKLQAALIDIQNKNLNEAKTILNSIPDDSFVKDISRELEHLSIKGETK